jgi:hypothetical protein
LTRCALHPKRRFDGKLAKVLPDAAMAAARFEKDSTGNQTQTRLSFPAVISQTLLFSWTRVPQFITGRCLL